MRSTASTARVRVERGIYIQPNGKYAICAWHAGKPHFRTVQSDLAGARQLRAVLVADLQAGRQPGHLLRLETVADLWIERFEAKVAAGERRPRTLEAHRYQLDHNLLPTLGQREVAGITVDDVAMLLLDLQRKVAPARPPRLRWRRCTQSFTMHAVTAGRVSIPSPSLSATSAPVPPSGRSGCSAASRSNCCWMRACRLTG